MYRTYHRNNTDIIRIFCILRNQNNQGTSPTVPGTEPGILDRLFGSLRLGALSAISQYTFYNCNQ